MLCRVIKYFLSIDPDRVIRFESEADLIPINFGYFYFC